MRYCTKHLTVRLVGLDTRQVESKVKPKAITTDVWGPSGAAGGAGEQSGAAVTEGATEGEEGDTCSLSFECEPPAEATTAAYTPHHHLSFDLVFERCEIQFVFSTRTIFEMSGLLHSTASKVMGFKMTDSILLKHCFRQQIMAAVHLNIHCHCVRLTL